jgi:anti-sigma B factor antagonist
LRRLARFAPTSPGRPTTPSILSPRPARVMAQLDLREQKNGQTTTLALSGELDFATAPELEAAVRRLCTSELGDEVILDLSALSFVDTTGVRAILTCKQLFDEHECGFWLISPRTRARQILERYGVLDQMPLRERAAQTS